MPDWGRFWADELLRRRPPSLLAAIFCAWPTSPGDWESSREEMVINGIFNWCSTSNRA